MQKTKKTKKTESPKKGNNFIKTVKESVLGISRIAFITATGTASYVLWFSTDSTTLHIIAGILAVRTAIDAIKMSRV